MSKVKKLFLGAAMLFCAVAFGQQKTYSGSVTEFGVTPIQGANVRVVGSHQGTTTDLDGNFSIQANKGNKLEITFVGMSKKIITLTDNTEIEVELETGATELEEVVVTAFGTTKKTDLTGSISTVSAADISKQSVSSVSNAISGTVAGVQVTSTTGQPGKDAKIIIRGVGSINASSEALIVVDGAPYQGKLSDINPTDIESMSISKDATANSLYGSRAANGVIMITTKKGNKSGKAKFSLEARVGVNSRAVPEYDIITDPTEYYELAWKAIRNFRFTYPGTESEPNPDMGNLALAGRWASDNLLSKEYLQGNNTFKGVPNSELINPATGKLNPDAQFRYYDPYSKNLFRNGIRQDYNFNASGGTEKMDYYVSLGYLNDQSYVKYSNFERFSGRINVNGELTKWLKMGASMSYSKNSRNEVQELEGTASNVFLTSRSKAPIIPVYAYDYEGNIKKDKFGEPLYNWGNAKDGLPDGAYDSGDNGNIVATMKEDIRTYTDNNLSARAYLEVNLSHGFKFNTNYSLDNLITSYNQYGTPIGGDAKSVNGRGYKEREYSTINNWNQIFSYNNSFGKNNVEALLGHEYYTYNYEYLFGHKTNFYDPSNDNFNNATSIQDLEQYEILHRVQGIFAKAAYNFDHKYFLSASFRRDRTSRFKNNPWGNFWSVGASWRIGEESFIKDNTDVINDLKIRGNYGTQGNERINAIETENGRFLGSEYYPYVDQYEVVDADGKPATVVAFFGNPDLTWETNKVFDIGVDFRLFNFLHGSLDYYSRVTSDMIYKVKKPQSFGRPYNYENVGAMVNSGFEFEISADLIKAEKLQWSLSLKGTTYKNKILDLPEDMKETGIQDAALYQKLMIGSDRYRYYIQEFAGVDQTTGESLWYKDVKDAEGNPVKDDKGNIKRETTNDYNQATQYLTDKSALPNFVGGISTSLNAYGLDFSILCDYQIGGYSYDTGYSRVMGTNIITGKHKDLWNAWSPDEPNRESNIPYNNLGASSSSNPTNPSDRFLTSASYFNIKNITLGYTFPKKWMEKIQMSSIRVYASADNVALFSARKGFDPRQNFSGKISDSYYSPIRTTSLGVSFNF